MKIAHLVCVFPPYKGGIGKSALDFASMMKEGNEIDILTPLYTQVYTKDNFKNIRVKRIKPLFKLGNGAFMPSLFFKLRKYDLVYLHYPFFGSAEIVWLFSFFNNKTKIILHYHMDVLGLSPIMKFLSIPSRLIEKNLLKRADLITVASFDYVENSDINNFYYKNKDKFRETYFPVDTEKFKPSEKKKEKRQKNILFVGGLDRAHYFKGLSVLFKALSFLKKRDDWHFSVVGSGDMVDEYKKIVKDYKIEDRIDFLGSLSDESLSEVYRESDLFVLPSINRGEAFGIVLLEAMSSALPVIASNLAGVRTVFSDNEGLLSNPGDPKDLSKKIEILLNDNKLLNYMSHSARNLVLKKYSYQKVSERLNKIINDFCL